MCLQNRIPIWSKSLIYLSSLIYCHTCLSPTESEVHACQNCSQSTVSAFSHKIFYLSLPSSNPDNQKKTKQELPPPWRSPWCPQSKFLSLFCTPVTIRAIMIFCLMLWLILFKPLLNIRQNPWLNRTCKPSHSLSYRKPQNIFGKLHISQKVTKGLGSK